MWLLAEVDNLGRGIILGVEDKRAIGLVLGGKLAYANGVPLVAMLHLNHRRHVCLTVYGNVHLLDA